MESVKRTQKLISADSGMILLPANAAIGNMSFPDLTAWDTVQKYDLTTKFRLNGKTFVYARAVQKGDGGEYANAQLISTKGAASASIVAIDWSTTNVHTHLAGVSQIAVEKAGVLKDEYAHGDVFLGVTTYQNRGILGNAKSDSDGYVTLDLDIPLSEDITHETTGMTLFRSRYAAVEWAGVDYEYTSIVGVPVINKAAGLLDGQWFWLQTWGSCQVSGSAGGLGANPSERCAVFDGQGQLLDIETAIDANTARQIAGYLLDKTKDAYETFAATNSGFIMLMLDA